MRNSSKHCHCASAHHHRNGSAEISALGRLARELRKLEDEWETLGAAIDEVGEAENDSDASFKRALIDIAVQDTRARADALRHLMVSETPKTPEDIATLFELLREELRGLHLHYIDYRFVFEPDERAAPIIPPETSCAERMLYARATARISRLTRSILLALDELAPSPLTTERDLARAREEHDTKAVVDIARAHCLAEAQAGTSNGTPRPEDKEERHA